MSPPPAPRREREPNGPTWRALALAVLILLIATVSVVATLSVVPTHPGQLVGVAYATEQLPGNGSFVFNPRQNISFPAGASLVSIAANYSIRGGYHLNLTVGWCLPGFGICLPPFPPPLYQGFNRSAGAFGWACGHPIECGGPPPLEIWVYGAPGQAWSLSWQVVYNYTATEPLL